MPNVNTPFGLLPVDRGYGGGALVTQDRRKASGTPSIYRGDVVVPTSSQTIIAATAAADYIGVAVHGIRTGRTGTVTVYENPQQRFIAQIDNVGGGFADGDGGNNVLLLYGTPSVTDWTLSNFIDRSAQVLSGTSKATTNTHCIRMDKLHDGSEYGDWAVVECVFNRHFHKLQGTGA
jgi:hypothetical protein